MLLPPEARPLALALLPVFTNPTYHRFLTLAAAAILTTGRRTVSNLLRTVGDLAPGNPASYRRVLSAAEWSGLGVGGALAGLSRSISSPTPGKGVRPHSAVTPHRVFSVRLSKLARAAP